MGTDSSDDDINIELVKRDNSEPDWRYLDSVSAISILFKGFAGKPICFHFKIDNATHKKKYEDLILKFGGITVENYIDMDERTALMVEDNCVTMLFERPSFKTSYVIDCIKKRTLLNIDDYIYNKYSFRNSDFMKIIFWRNESFKTTTVERYDGSSDSSIEESSVLINSKKVSKRTREMYTRSEKEAILKFILSKRKLEGLRGNSIWKTMEKRGVCPRRTYQSLKNHFLKTLVNELDNFEFLSEYEKRKMRNVNML